MAEASERARQSARANPDLRFAITNNGNAIGYWDDGRYTAFIERTILKSWVHGGINRPDSDWQPISVPSAPSVAKTI